LRLFLFGYYCRLNKEAREREQKLMEHVDKMAVQFEKNTAALQQIERSLSGLEDEMKDTQERVLNHFRQRETNGYTVILRCPIRPGGGAFLFSFVKTFLRLCNKTGFNHFFLIHLSRYF
jgi:hypothetical protein